MSDPEPLLTEKPPRYPSRRREVLDAALRQLEQGDWTRLEGAPETEEALQQYHGVDHLWYVSSGTAALEALMLGHEIGPGDEVITTPYTWGATVSSILAIGAVPVFADIDPITGLMDPETVVSRITEKTKAVLVVHLFGHPVRIDRFREIADAHRLLLFEDGSQAHGATWKGRRVGSMGDGAAFSCMGLKLLAGTEGGYAIFKNAEAMERAFLYGRHPRGMNAERVRILEEQGLLDSLQLGWRPCAVGAELVRAALPYLDEENEGRRQNAEWLREALHGLEAITMPVEYDGARGCYHLLSLIYREEITGKARSEFVRDLKKLGAECFLYIPVPIHKQRRMNAHGYKGPRVHWHAWTGHIDYAASPCPNADWRAARSVEFGFNWTVPNQRAMEQFASALKAAC